jgi:hypothetical protein
MILNKQVSETEFAETLKKLNGDSEFREEFEKKYLALRLEVPVKSFWDKNSENVSGNYIVNSKNAHNVFNVKDVEDGRHCYEVGKLKDGMDVTRCGNGEFLYEVKGVIDLMFSKFCNLCYQCSQLEYCDNCQSSHNNFGSMSLKGNKYCILNKQYSEQDYKIMIEKIKEHMKKTGEYGEFFPVRLSVFGYNETKAQDFYPLTKEVALDKGFKWKDADPKMYQAQTYKILEKIEETDDAICNEVLACENCAKNYKIIPQELKFYRDGSYPVPKKCLDCRHRYRMSLQNPRKLWDRNCMKCSAAIKTTYAPERKEKVYCEKCYLNEIQ